MRTLAHIAAMLCPTAAVTFFLQHPGPRYALGADEKPGLAVPLRRSSSPPVAGRILDAWGLPVPNATVHVVAADNHALVERTETSTDGSFHVDKKLSAKVRVVARGRSRGLRRKR